MSGTTGRNRFTKRTAFVFIGILLLTLAVARDVAVVASSPNSVGASGRIIDGRVDDWHGATSRVGGSWQYSSGELVYQDHLYDDLGPDTGQRSQQHSTLGFSRGDYRYPTDEARYGNNAGDFLELRFAVDDEWMWFLARMNTLKVPDGTAVAVGVDTDGDVSTGGGPWPYSAGIRASGADIVFTLWGTGGTITRLIDGSSVPIADVAADTSNENNAIEARIPRDVIGDGDMIRVWAASGLWDVARSEWIAAVSGSPTIDKPGGGSPTVPARAFNVAFRPDEGGTFMEERQAAVLRTGDVTPLHANVDLARLERGDDLPYRIEPGRFYAIVMDQRRSIPPHHEGMSYEGIPGRFAGLGSLALEQTFDFYGRHQPYGLYVPSGYDGTTSQPAALVLHGLGGSHSSYNSQPGFLRDMGEGDPGGGLPSMFLITPLARGSSFYADWGEADTLAVLSDVKDHFLIDPERLYITGYSMGGYGTYRLASLYPDLFAAAGAWAGYTGEYLGVYLTDPRSLIGDPTGLSDAIGGAVRPLFTPLGVGEGRAGGKASIGNPVDTLENLRHLPIAHFAGTNDEIVPTTGQLAAPLRLAQLGQRSLLQVYPGYDHYLFAIVDDWKQMRSWLGNKTREEAPRDITYKFSDGWTTPGLADELGLVHGNAWWLKNLRMREPTTDGLVLATAKATSRAIEGREVLPRQSSGIGVVPTPHLSQTISWDEGQALPRSNGLDLDLDGIGRAEVDLVGAQLTPCGLKLGLRTDGPARIELLGPFPSWAIASEPTGVDTALGADGLSVEVDSAFEGEITVSCFAFLKDLARFLFL